MKKWQNHDEAIQSYVNGNISIFKEYLRSLNKVELLECLDIFINDYKYSIRKMIWLLEK